MSGVDVLVTRQPIFSPQLAVFAYELSFGIAGREVGQRTVVESPRVLAESLLAIGLEAITGGRRAFVRFSAEMLIGGFAALLPADQTVVHLPGDLDDAAVAACEELREAGYLLACDATGEVMDELRVVESLVDLVAVDFSRVAGPQRAMLAERFAPTRVKLVAERADTLEDFEEANRLGYGYFQGAFISQPATVSGRQLPAWRRSYLLALKALQRNEIDYDELEEIIKQDVSLSYKVLRYVNSSAFGLTRQIESIRQALVLLGQQEVKKLVSMIALSGMGNDKPEELLVTSAVRASFCEDVGMSAGLAVPPLDLFMTGMFSMIDAILDRPLPQALEGIPISDEARAAILDGEGQLGDVLRAVVAYEAGDWTGVAAAGERLGVADGEVFRCYLGALERWMDRAEA